MKSKTVNRSDQYARRVWRGFEFDNRTISALEWTEKHYLRFGFRRQRVRFGQGSYSDAALSAGTHSGGGAVDVMFVGVPDRHRRAWNRWARRAGFGGWPRLYPQWEKNNEHWHGILLGHRTASPEAKAQMASYRAGRDGLVGNLLDKYWRPPHERRWSHRLNRPVVRRPL